MIILKMTMMMRSKLNQLLNQKLTIPGSNNRGNSSSMSAMVLWSAFENIHWWRYIAVSSMYFCTFEASSFHVLHFSHCFIWVGSSIAKNDKISMVKRCVTEYCFTVFERLRKPQKEIPIWFTILHCYRKLMYLVIFRVC